MSITIVSWNVNGIRAALKKGLLDFIKNENPDIICFQETKANKGQVEIDLPEYEEYWNSAEKKGYSGTAVFTKYKPLSVSFGLSNYSEKTLNDEQNRDALNEGRVTTLEYDKFYLVNVYTPNAKPTLERLNFRHKTWDPLFLDYVKNLEKSKPVIFCGDLNVAHEEIDIARPDQNRKKAGFTDEEREGFDNIVKANFVDTFRIFNKEPGFYSWWSHFAKSRERNIGWRIDYICVSDVLKSKVKEAYIKSEVMGSDHCPVGILLDIKL